MHRDVFEQRHHGLSDADISSMLAAVDAASIDQLIDQTVPSQIRLHTPLNGKCSQSCPVSQP